MDIDFSADEEEKKEGDTESEQPEAVKEAMEASIKLLNQAGTDKLIEIADENHDLSLKKQATSGLLEFEYRKKERQVPNFLPEEDYKLSKRDIADKIHDKLVYAFKVVKQLEITMDQIY